MADRIAVRVAAGCAWLEETDPGWWRQDAPRRGKGGGPIDLDELRMADPCNCVLGQRWGDYYYARIALDEAVAMGFDTESGSTGTWYGLDARAVAERSAAMSTEFDELTAEWTRVITERRTTAGAVVSDA